MNEKPYIHLIIAIMVSLFICGATPAQVAINEVGYYMSRSSDTGLEWIELYNADSTAHDISGCDLYPGRSPHYLVPAGFVLGPRSFALVHLRKDGTNTATDLYEGTAGVSSNMPNTKGSVALFTSASRDTILDFAQYGGAGQTYEATAANALLWTRGDFVDTCACGGSIGLAVDGADSGRSADWRQFTRPTPGYSNNPPLYDAAVTAITTSPLEVPADQAFQLTVTVASMGTQPAPNAELIVFEDANGDSVYDGSDRCFYRTQWGTLDGAVDCPVPMPALSEGVLKLAATITCSGDPNPRNNIRFVTLTVGSPLAVNEIMYAPNTGEPEWVELYNRSVAAITLDGWTIEDGSAAPKTIDTAHTVIAPGGYAIVTSIAHRPDVGCPRLVPIGGMPSLNNDGDLVRIRDGRGAAVDAVSYQSPWGGGAGVSLERVNPFLDPADRRSWGGCVSTSGSTPGAANSIYIEKSSSGASLSADPNPFAPSGGGGESRTLVSFSLAWLRAQASITVFDRLGRKVRTLADHQDFGATGTVVWDGRDDGGGLCPMGLYIILLEARDANGSATVKRTQAVAVARKL